MIIILISCTQKPYEAKYAEISDAEWVKINPQHCGFETKEDFLKAVDTYVEEISNYLKTPDWNNSYKEEHGDKYNGKISIIFVDGVSRSYTYPTMPTILINIELFEHRAAPVVHELTHVIMHSGKSSTLIEGLAGYCQDKFGGNPAPLNWGFDPHSFSKIHMTSEFDDILERIGKHGGSNLIFGKIRTAYYVFSYSYTDYIIENYGLDTLLTLYASDDYADYQKLCNKSFEQLKNDWIEYVKAYPEEFTIDDVSNYRVKYYLEHGGKMVDNKPQ